MWRHKKVVGLLGVLSGVYMAIAFVNPWQGSITLAELVLQLSGSRGEFPLGCSPSELMEYMLRMVPGYVAIMILGKNLYAHFCTASIYVFSRCENRLKWYRHAVFSLLEEVCLFEVLYTGTVIAVTLLRYRITFSAGGFMLLAYHILIYIMWRYAWILLMNLCAMKAGSSIAYAVVMGFQAICVAGLGIVHMLELKAAAARTVEAWVYLNPIAHTIIGWHGSSVLAEELAGSRYSMNLWISAAVLVLFCAAVLFCGGILVQRHDLLVEDIELGAI